MMHTDTVQMIPTYSTSQLELFSESEIQTLSQRIFTQTVRGKTTPFITCALRNREIQLKSEEYIRQLYTAQLIEKYGYSQTRLEFEYPVSFGRERKRADIVVFDKDRPDAPFIIIEVKKARLLDGKAQLRSYCNATGAPIGVWTNGNQISRYHRKDPNYFEEIADIPNANQTIEDILNERFTLKNLFLKNKLVTDRRSLKELILELEDEVLANAGVDVFEEVFKLIFTKLYDEFKSQDDKVVINRFLERHQVNATIYESSTSYNLERPNYNVLKKTIEKIPDSDMIRPEVPTFI